MDWQLSITLAAILLAIGYFAWQGYRTWRRAKTGACAGGCCEKGPSNDAKGNSLIPVESLTMRVKR